MLRSAFVLLTMLVLTPPLALLVTCAAVLGIKDRPGNVYWWAPRVWARGVLRAASVKVRVHGAEHIGNGRMPRVFVCNHVSWFDVFTLAAILPRPSFVAKAEILRIPIFGPGARAVGTIPIERTNQKSAFASYDQAAEQVRGGRGVVVFPEGTRGRSYALRPFKKGPFVLAIGAQAPIVPVVVHGTLPIMPKGRWQVRPGVVDVHFLDPLPTVGLTYEDRDSLVQQVQARMEALLRQEYGVSADAPSSSSMSSSLLPAYGTT